MKYLLLLLSLSALLLGCKPPQNNADTDASRVKLELAEKATNGPATVRVYLLNEDNSATEGAKVTVTGMMNHAGMEPVIADAAQTSAGVYETKDFAFTMAGDWIIEADAEMPDGSKATAELPVTVPSN